MPEETKAAPEGPIAKPVSEAPTAKAAPKGPPVSVTPEAPSSRATPESVVTGSTPERPVRLQAPESSLASARPEVAPPNSTQETNAPVVRREAVSPSTDPVAKPLAAENTSRASTPSPAPPRPLSDVPVAAAAPARPEGQQLQPTVEPAPSPTGSTQEHPQSLRTYDGAATPVQSGDAERSAPQALKADAPAPSLSPTGPSMPRVLAEPPRLSEPARPAEPADLPRPAVQNAATATERSSPPERAATGLQNEALVTSETVRQAAKADSERRPASSRPASAEGATPRAGEESTTEPVAPRPQPDPPAAPHTARTLPADEAPAPLPAAPLATPPTAGVAAALGTVRSAILEDATAALDPTVLSAEPLAPTVLPAADAPPSGDDGVRPAAPPVPARLSMPVWLERLTPASDRFVQVGLGDDGSVRLHTLRQPDGITVQIHFSDPELQALAGVHADRLRTALETHFAEPVRLSLSNELASDAGSTDSGASDPGSRDPSRRNASAQETHSPRPDLPSHTPSRSSHEGRREWVG
ncbi:MAG: hypothetical protein Rubg2KO_36830 [Rubricoccaceae bacterium]